MVNIRGIVVAVVLTACNLVAGSHAALASSTPVSLAFAANVEAIAKNGEAVPGGGLDQTGNAYSSTLLGATATWNGVNFALGLPGEPSAASGSTFSLPAGSYSQLSLLATGVDGNQENQTFVVTYTDGTSSSITQDLSDWHTPQKYAGESEALTEPYRLNIYGGIHTGPYYVYGYSFALNSNKTVKSLALPKNRNVVVLAVSLTSRTATSVNITAASNVDGIAKTGTAVPGGGMDGEGNAYASALLGSTASWAGETFALGQPDAPDAVSNATFGLPAGSYTNLHMLAAGVDGNQQDQTFVVTYSDGATTTFKQSLSDWHTPQHYAGESQALTESYRLNASGGIHNGPYYVYGYSFALNSAKTVKSLTLPHTRGVVVLAVTMSSGSGTGSSTPPSASTPAVPANLTAHAGAGQVGLGWSASARAADYHVKRGTTSGGPYTMVGAVGTTAYTDAPLKDGKMYYYVVSAVDSTGESANSAQVSAAPVATAPPTVAAPAVPAGLAATAGNAQITLSWSPSSNATSYTLQRATSSGGPYTQVSTPSTTSYTDTALANSTAYFYVVAATDSAGTSANSAEVTATPTAPVVVTPPPVVGSNCGLQLGGAVIFCDTFDAPAGIGNRSGDLNGNVWGVSRDVGNVNIGQGQYNATPATQLLTCNGTTTVRAPNDVIICNGQLHEATNDNPAGVFEGGGVTSLAMYPKQPFDFAGRTGTVAFDVSNDSHGGHATWPEFWMSNLPVPVPFNHFNSLISLPQHGFGVRMAAHTPPGDPGLCPNGNNMDKDRWTVDSAVVVRNYIYEDTNYQGVNFGTPSNPPIKLNLLDCVLSPADGSGVMNHIEVRVTQSEIDIYATDAGVAPSPTSLRKIASITNANLSLTRGLIWLEDVHYNADKGGLPSQREHTFIWDNVAFDGPFTDRDFAYDALDANQPGPAYNAWNTGKYAPTNQTASWNVLNMPANPQATVVRVTFQGTSDGDPVPSTINVIVNGHAHATPWPFPDQQTNTWRTYAVTIPITDLVAGTNVVQLGANSPFITANVDIVLAGVPGGVPVLPGNPTAYPGSSQ